MMEGMEDVEWALIDAAEAGTSASADGAENRVQELAAAVLEADFKAVLLSPEAKDVFASIPALFDGFGLPSLSDSKRDDSLAGPSKSNIAPPPANQDEESYTRLIVAIALLESFVQINWTGPDLDFNPLAALSHDDSSISMVDLNAAAVPLLTLNGEPAYHLASDPVLFLLGKRLLEHIPQSLPTLAWWKLRAHRIHLSLLDEPVELPMEEMDAVRALEGKISKDRPDLLAKYHSELGLLYHALGSDKNANAEFGAAAQASGLEYELTGALGKKTKFQIDPHTQLVLLAQSRDRDVSQTTFHTNGKTPSASEVTMPQTLALNDDTLLEETEFLTKTHDTEGLAEASTSRLSHLDPASQPPLHPLDQALLLSMCLSEHHFIPESGLTASGMMPFVTRVISHPQNWSVHTTALLIRSRLEANRSRTVERSTLQLAALIEQMPTSDSSSKERLRYFHQLPLPSRWEMERELAKRYLSLGVVRSALDIFTKLEMWEDAASCLQRMEKEEEAEKIVRDLLEGKKVESDLVVTMGRAGLSESRRTKLTAAREAKLWCLLGDLALSSEKARQDPQTAKMTAMADYEKAWDISGHTSSRAMRSLGSLYFSAREYEKVVPCLRKALEINPLYARTWFTLGVSLVRLERWIEARDAFRREVAVDDEDSEGWNNLAAVYLRLHEEEKANGESPSPSVTPFQDKLLAFRALRQGLRFSPTNWRMWSNYMIISLDVGELSESARAMAKVIDQRPKDGTNPVDVDVVDKLVDSVTRDDYALASQGTVVPKTSNEGFGLLPILERLFDQSILTAVSDSQRIWKAHGRLLRWKEDWPGAMEDYLRAYRSGPANDPGIETDREKFKEGVSELEELVGVMQLLGPKVKKEEGKKGGDWRFQARGLVRTFIGRTKASFEDEPEMDKLKELLDDLKKAE